MDPRPALVRDWRFREHRSPAPHPERPERLDAIDRALEPLGDAVRDQEPRVATDEEIASVHSRDYLEQLRALEGREADLDPDTYVAPRSLEIARLAAGGTIDLALGVARGEAQRAFALVRPPGHHAEAARGMGFCLLNNVALAARALRGRAGVERIAIVDWDVHHGQGTQHLFESERDVLFLSLHQFPLYPGTGALTEMGTGEGEGATLNLPLPAGCGDPEYLALFESVVVPVLHQSRPEIVLVSAGFDAHERDPLASMRVTSAGFRSMAAHLRAVADEICGGRMLLCLEGGYDLGALGEAVAAVTEVLAAPEAEAPARPAASSAAPRLAEGFREAHAAHWAALRSGPRMSR